MIGHNGGAREDELLFRFPRSPIDREIEYYECGAELALFQVCPITVLRKVNMRIIRNGLKYKSEKV